jgi:hypothetical protein
VILAAVARPNRWWGRTAPDKVASTDDDEARLKLLQDGNKAPIY